MFMPSVFGENLFDDWMDSFDDFDRYFFGRKILCMGSTQRT